MAAAHLAARLRAWIWLLIYGGIVWLGLGLVVRRSDDAFGWTIAAFGIAAIAVGIALIGFRSRLGNNEKI